MNETVTKYQFFWGIIYIQLFITLNFVNTWQTHERLLQVMFVIALLGFIGTSSSKEDKRP